MAIKNRIDILINNVWDDNKILNETRDDLFNQIVRAVDQLVQGGSAGEGASAEEVNS